MKKDFFHPENLAIIGASPHPDKLGFQITQNLKKAGFKGGIFPVNLKEKEILGLKTYPSVLDINRRLDLALIVVPRGIVPQVLIQCVHKEIHYVVIISAGFAEKDKMGKKLQQEVAEICHGTKTKIIGPNCLGLINSQIGLNLTFAASQVAKGSISLVLQSGAIGAAVLDWANQNNFGINKFISLGNEVGVTVSDSLRILADDETTKVIGVYIEQIKDPINFLVHGREFTSKKPIVILKGGTTEQGSEAAASHTAALVSSHALVSSLFKQANIIAAENYEDFLNLLEFFLLKNLNVKNKNLAVVTNAGGPGILAADAASRYGLMLLEPPKAFQNVLESEKTEFASLSNPFDLSGMALASDYELVIRKLEASHNYGAILAILTPQSITQEEKTAQVIAQYARSKTPVVATFLGGEKIEKGISILNKHRIPNYSDPDCAIEYIAKVYDYYHQNALESHEIKIPRRENAVEENKLAEAFGIPFVETHLVNSHADVMGLAEKISFPLVYKTAKKVAHKQKAGKVGLNISDEAVLKNAVEKIGFPGILQKMISSPYEVFMGAKRDPQFGIVLTFGRGGIFVEEEKDISFRIMPLTDLDLEGMIKETEVWKSVAEMDVKEKIKQALKSTLSIILSNPRIKEVEFNPFKVLKNKIIAVDINVTYNGA